jgi:predicted PolB exonuclease-like 3'-5' exonuclease
VLPRRCGSKPDQNSALTRGLAGKPQGIDGSQVEELANAGRLDQVAEYCETDVFTTYRVWLVYELFRGSIKPAELEWSEAQAREFIVSRRKSNHYLSAAMGVQGS